jgi:hypothetical protein
MIVRYPSTGMLLHPGDGQHAQTSKRLPLFEEDPARRLPASRGGVLQPLTEPLQRQTTRTIL